MKKVSTKQKLRWNKLSANRRRRQMKRRPHVEALRETQKKINLALRQIEAIKYFRAKYSKQERPEGNIL
tara:strand:+ start:134 stop:340 length:207 start_codon:yes stop_codon:yes gene_type:complete